MTTHSIEHILGAAARGVLLRAEGAPRATSVRTQSAVVRSLVHELEHRAASDGCLAGLREQVKEELMRLMRLMHMHEREESLSGASSPS